ncbi:MAG: TPM domain-containing protein [Flammeovirgaceae bacterium]
MNLFTKSKKKQFFTPEEEKALIQAIEEAEQATSGEIKVHVESTCKNDAFARALELFAELDMHETAQRNGVLFYLAMESHKFAIVADEGINRVVPENFWEEIKKNMRNRFKEGKFVAGIQKGITMAGEQLKMHFPYQDDDENEISDELSKGD